MTESAPKLTLTYHRFSASAETLRLAAAIGKIRFTNRAIDEKDWVPPPGKQSDPRYKLPVLAIEVRGQEKQVIANRNAILRYMGRRGGLYPTDPLEGLQIEYMLDTVSEALRPLETVNDGISSLLSENPLGEEQLIKIREGIGSNSEYGLPHYLKFFESALKENYQNKKSKWIVGENVSIADLKLYQLVCWISGGVGDGDGPSLVKGIESSLIEDYPLLLKHKQQIETLPEVLSWRAKYVPPYSVFEYRPPFEFRSIGRRSRLGSHHDPIHPTVGRLNPSMASPQGKKRAMFPRITLTYFETSGRAEPIRLAAAVGRIPFTNRVMSAQDWEQRKRYSPLGQLPTLTVLEPGKDLVVAPQSTAILRYIGKLGGLYPTDEIQAVQVDFMMETISHAMRLAEMTTTGVVKSLILDVLFTEGERRQVQGRVMSNTDSGLPLYLNYFESVLDRNKEHGWLVGRLLTIADLNLYHLSSYLIGELSEEGRDEKIHSSGPPVLRDFPLIRQHAESMKTNQFITKFRARFKPPYSTFDYNPLQDQAEDFEKKSKDTPPRWGRRIGSDGLPKNVSRSKSSDQIPKVATRRPGFSPPSPVQRRSSIEENETQTGHDAEKTDKMMSVPLRRKPSFEDDAPPEGEELQRRKSRGASMPPRPRPVSIIDDDDNEDDECFSFSEKSSDSDDLNFNAPMKSPPGKIRSDFADDSSSGSADDGSSISSADLVGLQTRRQYSSGAGNNVALPADGPAPYNWKSEKKLKKKKSKNKKKAALTSLHDVSTPKLPANTPRNRPSITSPNHSATKKEAMKKVTSKKSLPKKPPSRKGSSKKGAAESKKAGKGVGVQKETKGDESNAKKLKAADVAKGTNKAESARPKGADEPMYKWDEKEKVVSGVSPKKKSGTPKNQRRTKKLPSVSPRGHKRFPSNNPRRSTKIPQMPKGLLDDDIAQMDAANKKDDIGFLSKPEQSMATSDVKKTGSFSSKKKRILIYFSIPGRAEPIRLAAVISKLPFTNLSISPEEADIAHRHMAPLQQFPVLEIEEAHNRRLTVPQSNAILRYMGMLGDLYPQDPLDALVVDSMCDSVDDALRLIETTCRSSPRSILEFKTFSDDECVEMRKRIAEDRDNGILSYLSFFEKALESNFSKFGVWLAQKTLTIADLRLYQLHTWLSGTFGACLNGDSLAGMPKDILNGFPLLELHKERVEETSDVLTFRSRHSWPYSTFNFHPEEEGLPEERDCSYRVSDTSAVPRLTVTHAWGTLNVEPILLAAAIGKLAFVNKVIEPEGQEWKNVYARRFALSELPVLEIEEPSVERKFVTRPVAILRYLCKLGNLYPSDPIRALEVESMIETIVEIQSLIKVSTDESMQTLMSGAPWSDNETWSVRRRIAKSKEQGLPYYLTYFEKAIAENPSSAWLVGPTVTMADLCLYNFFTSIMHGTKNEEGQEPAWQKNGGRSRLDGFPDNLIDDFPVLKTHAKTIEGLSAVESFKSKHQPPYNITFAFRPSAA